MSIRRNLSLKKILIKKGVSLITIASLISCTSSTIVFAQENNSNSNATTNQLYGNRQYTYQYLNSLPYDELVSLIKKISWQQVPNLFDFNGDSYEFFSNSDRVQAIIDELERSGASFTDKNNEGIPTLVEFLRAGFYLGYYHEQLSYLKDINFKNRCLPALRAIEANQYFALGTPAQDSVIEALGNFSGNGSLDVGIINKLSNILGDYYTHLYDYAKDNGKGRALYAVIKNVDYFLYSEMLNHGYKAKNTAYYGQIDNYLDKLGNLAEVSSSLDSNSDWLKNNLIFYTGKDSVFSVDPINSQDVLTRCAKKYPYLSRQYIEVLFSLKTYFKGKFSDGSSIEYDKKMDTAKEKYLPKTYTFDNGKIIVKTGDKVSEEKVKRLYWASKEVTSQFMRVVGNDKPLEKGHADDVLKIVIYNSPKEYELNQKLYGYSTDNGGIYIEPVGTFFTYERTPEESIYTLEELFRHEFTHYLQGRYLVPGIWGKGKFYKGNPTRLTWFEEGSAEFFAGSTRTNDIQPRKSIIQNLSPDRTRRENSNEVLHAKYGSWDFYNYGDAFTDYMYRENLNELQTINNDIKNNDVTGYDNYIKSLSSDSYVDEAYENHMDKLINELPNLNVPLVSDDYTKPHEYKKSDEIYNDIESVISMKNVKTNEEKSQFFKTFNLEGSYIGGKSVDKVTDWKDMNTKINKALKDLDKKVWSGYKTITAYFTDYKVDNNGNYNFQVHFHGILTNDKTPSKIENKLPVCKIVSDKINVNTCDKISFTGKDSKDEDGSIKCYNWDFGDETKAEGVNVEHSFSKEGDYKVKLTITDNKGGVSSKTIDINVKSKKQDIGHIKENEPNNSINEAMGIFTSDNPINATLSYDDSKDLYYFDITKEGDVNIKLNNKDNYPINWYVTNEEDSSSYVAYADTNGNMLTGKFHGKPGRYYLTVYTYNHENTKGNYTIEVNGNLKAFDKSESKRTINEKENNNEFENAMTVANDSIIKGSVSATDDKDIYKITIKDPSKLNINLLCNSNAGINWLLFKKDDLENYVTSANINGGLLKNNYNAEPGEYYLCVYKYDNGNKQPYTLSLNCK
ncbi:collagenase [Clostridium tarantellae]|uniref:microbial collagenase n=1 Tax=Clostridium tarantellae TaxID=39493 RepID=A0A6I1MQC2_9CLOT|nr:collagenase [Clostridium tarantellae]MPQ44357.1 PKD domain-containing protein [Clostridium tarantellae]